MFPYTPEVLTSVVASFNEATWPLAAAVLGVMVGALMVAAVPQPGGTRIVGAVLAAAWVWVAVGWHFGRFAAINFAAPVYGVFFLAEAALILWLMTARGDLDFRRGLDPFRAAGAGLALFAFAGLPLLTVALGGPAAGARVAGMAPGATALATLGLLLMAAPVGGCWGAAALGVIPLLWCLMAGATAWLIGVPEDLLLPILGPAAMGLLIWRARRGPAAPATA